MGGDGEDFLLLNTVKKNPKDSEEFEQIPFFKDIESMNIKFYPEENIHKFKIGKHIDSLGVYGEILRPYTVNVVTSIDNYKNILEIIDKENLELNGEIKKRNYTLNLKVPKEKILETYEDIGNILKEKVAFDESYNTLNEVVLEEHRKYEDLSTMLIISLLIVIVFIVNIVNGYSSINLSFMTRKKEIGTIYSLGIIKEDLEKILKREYLLEQLKAFLLLIILNIISFLIISKFFGRLSMTSIIRNISFIGFFAFTFLVFFANYIIYIKTMKNITEKNIIELIS